MEAQKTTIKKNSKAEVKAIGDKCLIPECNHNKGTDDIYFCNEHREYWRRFCIYNRLDENTNDYEVRSGLNHYINNIGAI